MGHYAKNCPSSTSSTHMESRSLQIIITMAQPTNDVPVNDTINPNWLLLDTCYTISSIKNKYIVKYICASDAGKEIWAYKNGGHQEYNYTTTTTIPPLKCFATNFSLQTYYCLLQWHAYSVPPLTHTLTPWSMWISKMAPAPSSKNEVGAYIIMTLLT